MFINRLFLVLFFIFGSLAANNIEKSKNLHVTSVFTNGTFMAQKYARDGESISPPLAWQNAPAGTRSFAVICDDPDAPLGVWNHWVIYNIPATQTKLAERMPTISVLSDGLKQGKSSAGSIGYSGPYPPPGKAHRYFFKVYALDLSLTGAAPGLNKKQLFKLIAGHILAEGEVFGLYQRD